MTGAQLAALGVVVNTLAIVCFLWGMIDAWRARNGGD